MNKEQLQKIVFEALGEVSMCWSETPTGLFESTRANEIGNRIMKAFDEYSLPSTSLPSDEEGLKAIRTEIISKYLQRNTSENGVETFFFYHQAMEEYASTRIAEMEKYIEELKNFIRLKCITPPTK